MIIKRILPAAALALTMLAGTSCAGRYYGSGGLGYAYGPPPPPRYGAYGYAPGPGYVWTDGYWDRGPRGWAWAGGSWRRPPRPRSAWVPGQWNAWRGDYRFRHGTGVETRRYRSR